MQNGLLYSFGTKITTITSELLTYKLVGGNVLIATMKTGFFLRI